MTKVAVAIFGIDGAAVPEAHHPIPKGSRSENSGASGKTPARSSGRVPGTKGCLALHGVRFHSASAVESRAWMSVWLVTWELPKADRKGIGLIFPNLDTEIGPA